MKTDEQWECRTLCATQMKARSGGWERTTPNYDHGLSRMKTAEGKASYELS